MTNISRNDKKLIQGAIRRTTNLPYGRTGNSRRRHSRLESKGFWGKNSSSLDVEKGSVVRVTSFDRDGNYWNFTAGGYAGNNDEVAVATTPQHSSCYGRVGLKFNGPVETKVVVIDRSHRCVTFAPGELHFQTCNKSPHALLWKESQLAGVGTITRAVVGLGMADEYPSFTGVDIAPENYLDNSNGDWVLIPQVGYDSLTAYQSAWTGTETDLTPEESFWRQRTGRSVYEENERNAYGVLCDGVIATDGIVFAKINMPSSQDFYPSSGLFRYARVVDDDGWGLRACVCGEHKVLWHTLPSGSDEQEVIAMLQLNTGEKRFNFTAYDGQTNPKISAVNSIAGDVEYITEVGAIRDFSFFEMPNDYPVEYVRPEVDEDDAWEGTGVYDRGEFYCTGCEPLAMTIGVRYGGASQTNFYYAGFGLTDKAHKVEFKTDDFVITVIDLLTYKIGLAFNELLESETYLLNRTITRDSYGKHYSKWSFVWDDAKMASTIGTGVVNSEGKIGTVTFYDRSRSNPIERPFTVSNPLNLSLQPNDNVMLLRKAGTNIWHVASSNGYSLVQQNYWDGRYYTQAVCDTRFYTQWYCDQNFAGAMDTSSDVDHTH